MARRNLLRSLAAASLLVVSSSGALLAAAATPAGAADQNLVVITVKDTGFTPETVDARVGDKIIFALDQSASTHHTITSDDNGNCPAQPGGPCWPEQRFDDGAACQSRNYQFPRFRCFVFNGPGKFPYYDRYAREAGADLHGTMVIAAAPTTTTTVRPPATTTTVAPTTTTRPTTTSTLPPTTTTTAPSTIHPFLISNPAPTTSTTAPPVQPGTNSAGSNKGGAGATVTTAGKDKGKSKAASTATPTTAAPAPPGAPATDPVFDPASLTPAPIVTPDIVTTPDPGESSQELDAAMAELLNREKPADDGKPLMLAALAALGIFLLAGGAWRWLHRGSRYFPA